MQQGCRVVEKEEENSVSQVAAVGMSSINIRLKFLYLNFMKSFKGAFRNTYKKNHEHHTPINNWKIPNSGVVNYQTSQLTSFYPFGKKSSSRKQIPLCFRLNSIYYACWAHRSAKSELRCTCSRNSVIIMVTVTPDCDSKVMRTLGISSTTEKTRSFLNCKQLSHSKTCFIAEKAYRHCYFATGLSTITFCSILDLNQLSVLRNSELDVNTFAISFCFCLLFYFSK